MNLFWNLATCPSVSFNADFPPVQAGCDLESISSLRVSPSLPHVDLVLKELNLKTFWKGKGINLKCYDDKGNCIIACDKAYYRPLEVDTLLGDSRKARKELKWKPKIDIKSLVKEMVKSELSNIINAK